MFVGGLFMKQKLALILALLVIIMLAACAKEEGTAAEPTTESNLPTDDIAAETAPEVLEKEDEENDGSGIKLLGLILHDDDSDRVRMTMYGFLHTAENLSAAAKIYRAAPGVETDAALDMAIEDGVDALLFFDPTRSCGSAIERAAQNGIKTVVSYHESDAKGLSANIVADSSEYYDELARGLAERMVERSLKSGKILIYGRSTSESFDAFSASIAASYPQFKVVSFNRTKTDVDAAVSELAQYLLYNRDIKGMYVADSDLASIAIKARSEAQKLFKAQGAPSPTPEPSLMPGQTPEPTPNPGLLTQIMITVFCNGLSDDNYDLFIDNDIYALCIEPYYEAAAEATMTLDRLLRGETVQTVSRVNRPIVYSETADKYKAVFEQMKVLFEVE